MPYAKKNTEKQRRMFHLSLSPSAALRFMYAESVCVCVVNMANSHGVRDIVSDSDTVS